MVCFELPLQLEFHTWVSLIINIWVISGNAKLSKPVMFKEDSSLYTR